MRHSPLPLRSNQTKATEDDDKDDDVYYDDEIAERRLADYRRKKNEEREDALRRENALNERGSPSCVSMPVRIPGAKPPTEHDKRMRLHIRRNLEQYNTKGQPMYMISHHPTVYRDPSGDVAIIEGTGVVTKHGVMVEETTRAATPK